MSVRPSVAYLRQIVERARKHADDRSAPSPRVVAVDAAEWTNGESLEIGGVEWKIALAPSVLEVREVLDESEERGERIVLLTPLSETQLGHDVRARLAGCKVYSLDVIGTLGRLFGATRVDTARLERPILEALIEHAPPDGYPPVLSGILGAEDVWDSFFRHVVGVPDPVVDLPALIRWTLAPRKLARWLGLRDDARERAREHLREMARAGADTLLGWIEHGNGKDALALAAVCQIVFASSASQGKNGAGIDSRELASVLDKAAVRLERFGGGAVVPVADGRALGEAAAEVARAIRPDEDPVAAEPIRAALARADELIASLDVTEAAWLGSLTAGSYARRLERFGAAIDRALAEPSPDALATARARLFAFEEHRLTPMRDARARSHMALRLVEWLAEPVRASRSFEEAARRWVLEESFVDWARECLAGGEDHTEVSKVYERLSERALERRRQSNVAFAKLLAGWLESGGESEQVLPVEMLIESVVAPLGASGHNVLLIVLDGMSWPIAHVLVDDLSTSEIADRSWFVAEREAEIDTGAITLVSTVPSITELARMSLFAGEIRRGVANDERKAFAEHPALVRNSRASHPPVLFHKADVTSGRGSITEEIRREIAESKRRFVGVVVNTIDDSLSGAQQQKTEWRLGAIKPLGQLLAEGFAAERVVILASDHGHVLHVPGPSLPSGEGGDRWRATESGPRSEGEILLRGRRVRGPEDRAEVVVLADEAIRYGRPKNGYHGGATPQEMLAPVLILTPHGREMEHLEPVDTEPPSWWRIEPERRVHAATELAPRRREVARALELASAPKETTEVKIAKDAKEPKEAEPVRAAAREAGGTTPAWIARLFASETWAAQRALNRKKTLSDEQIESLLLALDRAGGSLTTLAFAKALGTSRMRLDGFLAMAQRLLNVDGSDVLGHDRERDQVELDRELLWQQFELGG